MKQMVEEEKAANQDSKEQKKALKTDWIEQVPKVLCL